VVQSRVWEYLIHEHENGCLKHRSTSITYSGCNDLVYGYDSWYLDKRRPTSSYVFQGWKDLLGKFGLVQEEVFYGYQGLVHLTNSTEYKNGQVYRFIR